MTRRTARTPLALALVASLTLLSACATGAGTAPTEAPTEPALSGELTIYAAASLGAAFDELATEFEADNPGVDILPIVYDGSSTLAAQLLEGARADVFATADEANMEKVAELVDGSPEIFATNTLVIATPRGNPAGIEELSDLADPALTVVLCAPEVPCGSASQKLLDAAGVALTPASLEQNVTAVLTKVASTDADAGLVYRTDVADRADVDSIVPEGADAIVNSYPIATLAASANPTAAAAFAAFVTGERGQGILASYGFGAP
ncbi:MAG TPA: molybdate ABC transporter substrate-binding protein [Microbacterium sp.]|uniref:molybdate ABC transporter substrate-binding protein n=1 Tax=Microbacterium sp. TaxID=51671 RepID=UPI002C5F506D|nr:molybdate ABC transporter substrate-binding protein [Microbacterium sp.]HWI31146.1 molybdate ABC transporter substrate-binding protein [Microbacterium sp.]